MIRPAYFFDTSAIAKLYLDEVGSHRVKDIYNDPNNIIFISELSFVETVSAFRKIRNKNLINDDELNRIIRSFQGDFLENREGQESRYPISLNDVVYMAPNVMEKAHKLKDEDPQLQYLRSLDCLQLASWVLTQEKGIKSNFVSSDKRLAKIASAYKDSENYEAQVIDPSLCSCAMCELIK